MLRQLLRPALRNVSKRGSREYHEISGWKRATMEEVPMPQGSWQQYYDARQKTFNMQLAAGLIYTLGTIAYVANTGAIYFHWGPPVPKDQK